MPPVHSLPFDPHRQGIARGTLARPSTGFYVDGVNVIRTTRPCPTCTPDEPTARYCTVDRTVPGERGWRCKRCGVRWDLRQGAPWADDALTFSDAFHRNRPLAEALWLEGYRPAQARRLRPNDEVLHRPDGHPREAPPVPSTVDAVHVLPHRQAVLVLHEGLETTLYWQAEIWRRFRLEHLL